MKLSDAIEIDAPRHRVWAALNDEAILARCIPGCTAIERLSDSEMTATVSVKMGPVRANFAGSVALSDLDPPNGYRITGRGSSAMGGATGDAVIRLSDTPQGTLMSYEVEALVTGKIASLAQRFIEPTARNLSAQFFVRFSEILNEDNLSTLESTE
jgi:carbon monoxide dehydrogenase subunit G